MNRHAPGLAPGRMALARAFEHSRTLAPGALLIAAVGIVASSAVAFEERLSLASAGAQADAASTCLRFPSRATAALPVSSPCVAASHGPVRMPVTPPMSAPAEHVALDAAPEPLPAGEETHAAVGADLLPGGIADADAADALERLIAARVRDNLDGRASTAFAPDHLAPQQRTAQANRGGQKTIALLRVASLGGNAGLGGLGQGFSPKPEPSNATPMPTPGVTGRPDVHAASFGRGIELEPMKLPPLTRPDINWVASADCLAKPLRDILVEVAAKFGPLRVNSTCRSRRHNARVGGASRSFHLTGNAVDFRVPDDFKAIMAFLSGKKTVGGLKHYGRGVIHIDTGPRRTWANNSWGGRKARGKKRRRG